MAPDPTSPTFEVGFAAQTGQPIAVAAGVVRVTAPNTGPLTYTGTNSYIVGGETVAIIDPGPADRRHLAALKAAVGGRPVEAIVLSHTHRDHCAMVPLLRGQIDAPLWSGGATRHAGGAGWLADLLGREADLPLVPDRVLRDGDVLEVGGLKLAAIATPGHAANHFCFGVAGTPWLLSGDHVMGWSSSMILPGGGALAAYLGSLEKVAALPYRHYLPGHGGPIADGPGHARRLLAHRQLRNEQIVRAVTGGADRVGRLMAAIYPRLKPVLRPAARLTLLAHLEYLEANGLITVRRDLFGRRISPEPGGRIQP